MIQEFEIPPAHIARALADPVAATARARAARERIETELSFSRRMDTIDRACEELYRLEKQPDRH